MSILLPDQLQVCGVIRHSEGSLLIPVTQQNLSFTTNNNFKYEWQVCTQTCLSVKTNVTIKVVYSSHWYCLQNHIYFVKYLKSSRQPLGQTRSKTSTLIIFFFYHGILSYRIKPCIGFRIYTTACFFCRRVASSWVYKQIKQAIVFKYDQSYTEMNQWGD